MIEIIISIIILILLFLGFFISKNSKVFYLTSTITWLILIVLELTLFNMNYFYSKEYKEIKIDNYEIREGIRKNEDGSLTVIDTTKRYIEIYDINTKLNNVYIKLYNNDTNTTKINIAFGFTDQANKKYRSTPDRNIPFNKGEIIQFNFDGNTNRLRIYFNSNNKINFNIDEIVFNKRYEYKFNITRILVLFAIYLFIYFIKYCPCFSLKLNDSKSKKYIIGVIIGEVILMTLIFHLNSFFIKEDFSEIAPQRDQYKMLAEAFLKGQTYLDIEPSQILKELDNPYDTKLRNKAFKDTEEEYLWDVSYYNNKYYVYFGVAPVIFYYLPFYLFTGFHIKTSICVYITTILIVIGIFILLKKIASMWFKETTLGTYILLTLMFINGCGLLSAIGRPDHYNLPILMGIMFSIYGLYHWLKSYKNNNYKDMFIGSLLMALVATCRPQLLLTSFLAVPLFISIFKDDNKKNILKKLLVLSIPFILVALPLMKYNQVRFDSPFDFGANYNLTTNDMTKRGWKTSRIPLGLYYYLINPINVNLKFPFIHRSSVETNYMGTTIYENMPAGFIFTNVIVLYAFTLFKKKKQFKDKTPYLIGCILTIFAILIICVDTEMAGILPRYYLDFGYMLYLATFISILTFNKHITKDSKYIRIMKALLIIVLVYNILLQLSDSYVSKSNLFFYLRELFEFWI